MAAGVLSLGNVDLSPAAFRQGIPHETFRRLRREAPLYWYERGEGSPYWAVTTAADVQAISRDPETFSSWRGGIFIEDDELFPLEMAREMMIFMDPPAHTRYRRIVSRAFTPRAIAGLEQSVRKATNALIDQVCEQGECDLVRDLAAPLPLLVIADLVGIPEADCPKVLQWIKTLAEFSDPQSSPSLDVRFQSVTEAFTYAGALAEQRSQCPVSDLVTALVQADIRGEKLTESEFGMFFLFLATAGTETSRNVIAGGSVALIENPAERRKLEEHPDLIGNAVEELMRWVTPITYFRRTVTRDTTLRDTRLHEGDRVVMWYASANYDEELFDQPHRLDVTRPVPEQFSFGAIGPHYCLGAPLARLELRIAFQEMLRRMPEMTLNGPVETIWSNWMQGIRSMPVRFAPTNAASSS